ncbi:hypothetical protein Tco_1504614 [Tanacetum coccineum]
MRREMSDMKTELLALREPQRRARQPGPEASCPDHRDASRTLEMDIQEKEQKESQKQTNPNTEWKGQSQKSTK